MSDRKNEIVKIIRKAKSLLHEMQLISQQIWDANEDVNYCAEEKIEALKECISIMEKVVAKG